ncbi:hypothetical protein NKH54_22515 [Mesorhizobium sp. M1004]|uniref:hypothetical protein n=1 Tax=Mesorhizobium sp. M1004 TaxID=2957046 RepID=UPI00333C5A19
MAERFKAPVLKRGESHPDWSLLVPNSSVFWAFSLPPLADRFTLSLPFPHSPVPIAVPTISCDNQLALFANWGDVLSFRRTDAEDEESLKSELILGDLSPDQFIQFLREKSVHTACPICTVDDWEVASATNDPDGIGWWRRYIRRYGNARKGP